MIGRDEEMLGDLPIRAEQIYVVGPIAENPIGLFLAELAQDGSSIRVSFTLYLSRSILKMSLRRNFSNDPGSAVEIQSWQSPFNDGDAFEYLDADPKLAGQSTAYWLVLSNYDDSQEKTVGPAKAASNVDLSVPVSPASTDWDISLEAGAGGIQYACFSQRPGLDSRFGSAKLYAQNYLGVAPYAAIAQNSRVPFRFALEQTGEVITVTPVIVTDAGIESALASAGTLNRTLNGTATVPCKIFDLSVAELATGVQISFAASPESNITQWSIWRSARGAGFGAASNIGNVAPTGAARYTYLDTTGLAGQYDWYVVPVNAIGSGAASDPVNQNGIWTSADLPPNVPANNINQATVDSIDNGVNATIRVYGTGGTSSDWMRTTGFGTETYPHSSLAGYAYATTYFVMYDKTNAVYVVLTTMPSTMPDFYVWAGKVTTVAAGGGGGASGGGGGGGGAGGCVEIGTNVEFPWGFEEEAIEIASSDWQHLRAEGMPPLVVHPDTLISVFKRASELELGDRVEVGADGEWRPVIALMRVKRPSVKISRKVRHGVYLAAGYRVHNNKSYEA